MLGGRAPIESGARPIHTSWTELDGKSSTGTERIALSPVAIDLIASERRARHSSPMAESPARTSVISH